MTAAVPQPQSVPSGASEVIHHEGYDEAIRSPFVPVIRSVSGAERSDIVSLTRFFTNVEDDQDVVNRVQGEWFGGHIPTSATVEVTRLATDARLRLEIQAIAAVPAD